MNVAVVVLVLVGVVLGSLTLGDAGWLAGAIIGYLVAKVSHLSAQVTKMERDIGLLKSLPLEEKTAQNPLREPALDLQRAPDLQPESEPEPEPEPGQSDSEIGPGQADSEPAVPAQFFAEPLIQAQTPLAGQPVVAELQSSRHQPVPLARQPNPVDKLIAAISRFFTEGNPVVRVGMVVMFFGLSFLAKYASSEGLLPVELRLAAIAAVAIALMVLGWRTRNKEGGYGLVLQGGGIAALYLTIFAAAKLFSLLPSGFAFSLMFLVVLLGAAMAVLQNAQVLALIATVGGFLAPILTSDGSGSHVHLFTFYLLLNMGILTIAWFRTWRLLNWTGFVFTFVISSAWGVLQYEPHLYASTQPFLLAFFALYLTVSILFSLKQPPRLNGLVDGSLLFGLPTVGFGLQTALLKHTEYGLAVSAVVLSIIYLVLARGLWHRYKATHRVMIESFLALGVTFATLAIPLALDAEWTSATWALEATGLIWVGLRQQRLLPRLAGYLLHVGAAVSLLRHGGPDTGTVPLLSGDFISLVLLSVSALCIAWLLHRFAEQLRQGERLVGFFALLSGWLWWLIAGLLELDAHVTADGLFAAVIAFFAVSCLALSLLSRRLDWPSISHTGFWLLPLSVLWWLGSDALLLTGASGLHPLQFKDWLTLLFFALVQYRFLWHQQEHNQQQQDYYNRQQQDTNRQWLVNSYHAVTAWFMIGLLYLEAAWWQGHNGWYGTSAAVLWFACFALPLVLLMQFTNKPVWLFQSSESVYKNVIPAPLLFLLGLWFINACGYSGSTSRFYLPLLNPLDLAMFAALLVFAYAIRRNMLRLALLSPAVRYGLLGGMLFVWLNVVLLRAMHHYTGIAYTEHVLWHSVDVQMALSILWTLCALLIMMLSRHKQSRQLWITGACLLALVVVKLFTVDLSGTGTLARIVSFMAVGGLMLLIGYLSPIPVKTFRNG